MPSWPTRSDFSALGVSVQSSGGICKTYTSAGASRMRNQWKEITMKRTMGCVIIIALLSGCTSAGSLRNAAPTAVYAGDATAEDALSCISNAWSAKQLPMSTGNVFGGTSIQLQEKTDG